MSSRILVSGPVSWNQLVVVDALPDPRPHTVFATDSWETIGGTSAGKALTLGSLGCDVVLHTVVARDAVGERIEATLASAAVTTVIEYGDGGSERHLNLMTPAGERVSIYLDTPVPRADRSRAVELALTADVAVIDLAAASLALLEPLTAAGIEIWTDIHDYDGQNPFHQPFIAAASYLFLNADGLGDPLEFMRSRIAEGAMLVVCTLGAEGAMAVDHDGVLHRVPAVPVETIVDTNGAGDAFFAGYLAAHLDGASVDEALAAGAAQASVALGSRHLSPVLDAVLDEGHGADPA
ncbi:MAG: PfkB family carbohydrate kinase [Ilumatobacteraceae bacterium]